jgi:Protein of unknown function (DUF1656)
VSFAEVDVFGVYVAPISVTMVAAWLVTIALGRIANRFAYFDTPGIRICSFLPSTLSFSRPGSWSPRGEAHHDSRRCQVEARQDHR